MNRREFITRTLAGIAGLAVADTVVDKFLGDTEVLSDEEFVTQFEFFINAQFQLMITNPRKCAYITNICEIDYDD
jgi:hypothetical protein